MSPPTTTETEAEKEILNFVAKYPEAGQRIIFAPTQPWDNKMFQRPQQMARALAQEGALVFYMQPDRSIPPLFTEIEDRLILCRTPADAFRVITDAFVYVLPWNIPLLAYFSSPRVIYDYLDDLSVFPGDPQRIRRDHGDMLLKADLVLAASERLRQEAASLRADSLLCPNGVNYPLFAVNATVTPEDLMPILAAGNPIIGYHGLFNKAVDYELLKTLAQKKTNCSFVLIGADQDQSLQNSDLLTRPNIYWLETKAYNDLPQYVSQFKIGIIPYLSNKATNATLPIKLLEYYAAGKPAVVPLLEECSRVPDVLIAATSEDWLEKIDQALIFADDLSHKDHLQTISRQYTWDVHAENIIKRLQIIQSIPRKQPWHVRLQPRNARIQQVIRLVGRGIKVWRMSGTSGFLKGIYYKLFERISHLRRHPLLHLPRQFDDTYIEEDNSQTTLYADQTDLFPNYWPRSSLAQLTEFSGLRVSLIATTYNENKQVVEWLESLQKQSRPPDEIVIVDGGSSDGTLETLRRFSENSPIAMLVISEPGANIARGRNIAIEAARYSIIAATDFGCRLDPQWLKHIMVPFQVETRTQVVAGWYRAVDGSGKELPYRGWPTLNEVDPQSFIPSSRSIAFTKQAWLLAGGYPEWLTLTGEDTYFALELKRHCTYWAFVPSAFVDWVGPLTWKEFWKKSYSWSIGNGEIGYNTWLYWMIGIRLMFYTLGYLVLYVLLGILLMRFLPLWPAWGGGFLSLGLFLFGSVYWKKKVTPAVAVATYGLRIAQVAGFWAGTKQKHTADLRRLPGTKGLAFILAGVPIDDTGGGARCTQIALELLRQNYWVVYIYRFPKWENDTAVIRIAHPNLYTYMLGEFSWDKFKAEFGQLLNKHKSWALIDFPAPEFLPLVRQLSQQGVHVLYDMIDDWNSSLGNWGYSPSIERELIRVSDGLIATAAILKTKVEEIGQREAVLLPNAVNSRLFNHEKSYQRPKDLPAAEWISTYIGALWGDWFDWDLLVAIANQYPQSAVVAVGDYRGQCSNPPANLYFLGLKPQTALPAYLTHTDVAIIPWKVNSITQATSPLKLYEYLAMRRPVIVPDLKPMQGIPGIFRAKNTEEFIRLVGEAREKRLPLEDIDAFVAENNWQARVGQLLKWIKDEI